MESKKKNVDLTTVISTAIQIPGVKVVRDSFLREQFKDVKPDVLELILEKGPVEAGCSRAELMKKANRIIKERTAVSTGASFLAGLPGGGCYGSDYPCGYDSVLWCCASYGAGAGLSLR